VKTKPRPSLERIVHLMARGEAIDWQTASESGAESDPALTGLRVVEKLARLARDERRAITAMRETAPPGRPEPEPRPAGPRRTWGTLELVEKIGQGSYGEVFRAHDPALQIDVALKLWFPRLSATSDAETFLQEARTLARIRHPNVLVVHGAASHDGRIGMWTELLSGETLEDFLEGRGLYGAGEAAIVGSELCRALAAVHGAGLVHRDVKTRNVMRVEGGRIVLMDFGSAGRTSGLVAGGKDSFLVGTPLAMAPEQLIGGTIGPTTDIYGLGVLLYRLVSGHYPVEGSSIDELAERHEKGLRTPLRDRRPDLPFEFVQIVERALAPDPTNRFASAGALEQALADFVQNEGHPREPRPPQPSPQEPADDRRHGFPGPLTSFIGREREVRECLELLRGSRLVSLIGPGGAGKTRLGLKVAEEWLNGSETGAWFVDLAPLDDDARVLQAIAASLAVRVAPSESLMTQVVKHLTDRRLIMVLDNCEQVRSGCAAVLGELLAACDRVVFIATSREPIGVPGEQSYPVPSLSYPDDRAGADIEKLRGYEAVRLFLERVRQVSPAFQLNRDNAAAVAEICRRLDGIPLALELIAARVPLLSPEEIRSRMDHVLKLGTSTRGTAGPRHRAIAATIKLSYDRLDLEERALFEELSLFRSGWTLESATAISRGARDEFEVLDMISGLAQRSLVVSEGQNGGHSRYRYLEIIRQFAYERLVESGREDEIADGLLDYFVGFAQQAHDNLWGPDHATWLKRVDLEHDNLIAMLDWACRAPERVERAQRMVAAIYRFWYTRGHFELGRRMLARVLESPGAETPSQARSGALFAAAGMAVLHNDYAIARRLYQEGYEDHQRFVGEKGAGKWMVGQGLVALHERDFALAEKLHMEALALFRATGDLSAVPIVLYNLYEISICQNQFDCARSHAEEALAVGRETNNGVAMAAALAALAGLDAWRHDTVASRARLIECFRIVRELDFRQIALDALESAAMLAVALGEPRRGARMLSASDALREAWGAPRGPAEVPVQAQRVAAIKAPLGEAEFDRAWAEGRSQTLEAATGEVLEWLAAMEQPTRPD
jgi:non-specific serine/threonine protein kinase